MKIRFLAAVTAMFALLLAPLPALAGNTTLFSPAKGDLVFPITPPSNAGTTAGTLDNTIIGATTPKAGTFTTVTTSGAIAGPVAATTLSASGAVTGAGITARFASPGPIGSTAASTVAATSLTFTGTAPTPTGTGTPTIAAGSTDNAGEVTAGASATSVVITFATAKTNAPFCVVRSQAQIASFAYTISTTAITITQTATSGNLIDYLCVQH